MRLLVLLICLGTVATAQKPWRYESIPRRNADPLSCAVITPENHDVNRPTPLLLAMPPGPQTREMVEAGMQRYWGEAAHKRGWIVLSPVAPKSGLFHRTNGDAIRDLIDWARSRYRIESNRIHLAGASNGVLSAFHVATRWPWEFASITVLPGAPTAADRTRLDALAGMGIDVTIWVGANDAKWRKRSERTVTRLDELKISNKLTVLDGEGHVPRSVDAEVFMKVVESKRVAQPSMDTPAGALDSFHAAAARADEATYFGAFAPEGVFLGTDATERWSGTEMAAWAAQYFARDSAWIYVPVRRHIDVHGDVAWFDEDVFNSKYHQCRGTGVLRRIDGTWRMTQYNLTFPVPNDLAGHLIDMITAGEAPGFGDRKKPAAVYLVRHAEKISDGTYNPQLTDKGRARAKELVRVLSDVKLAAVISSEFSRTIDTGKPTAAAAGLKVTEMAAGGMAAVARTILDEHVGKSVLVVGHSNTVPGVIKHLGVTDEFTMTDDDYDRLFIVTWTSDGTAVLTTLRYGATYP